MPAVATPDPAATILALRPATHRFEVLMVHRNSRGFFGNIVVFPGGKVDDVDVPRGLTRDDDVSHRNAAIREFAEETGILLTVSGPEPTPRVRDGEFYRWLEGGDVATAIDQLVLISRWVTPEMAPRRFDTRFYVIECDGAPEVTVDRDELIRHDWVTPDAALKRQEIGEWPMFRPTIAHLQWLNRWSSIDEAIGSAHGADGRTLIIPRRVDDGSLLPIHMPAQTP